MPSRSQKPSSKTVKLTVAYDGTPFTGWQRQNGSRTVQSCLESAFRKILQQSVKITGAGRTDSGVHAEGQVAHAVICSDMPIKTLHRALNAVLPEEVVIRSLSKTPKTFHARYEARRKTYRYTIWNKPERPLFERSCVWHIPAPLNLKTMERAARLLEGKRDFCAFHSAGRPVASTIRNLYRLRIRGKRGKIVITAEADGFLYHMVRRIVGLLVEIGKGRLEANAVMQSKVIPPTAPAKGLCLVRVHYD